MMNSYELMGSKSSPLCHMFDSDRLLASDSNEDSNDDHSGGGPHDKYEKYHTLDHLDSYDTVMDLENNLINCHTSALQSSHTTNGLTNDNHNQSQHLSQQNLNLNNNHLISNNNSQNNCNKRKTTADATTNGLPNGAPKRVPPPNGKKTKGRVKIKMEFIDNKLRRYTTFSKRKTGIMKKAYELSTLTGTQVMLLVASETGHVYTFATRKLQPMITSDAGKALIQTCLNSPDPNSCLMSGDQRMSATGFEETDLTYAVGDESPNDKSDESCDPPSGQCPSSGDSSEEGTDSPELLSSVMMSNGSASATTYAQLENALPLNYLTEANLISSKLANRQLLSQLTNANVLSTQSSLSHTSHSSPSSSGSSSSLVSCSSPMNSGTKNGSKQQFSGTKTNSIHNAIQGLPQISQTSAQHLLSAGNILLCANGSQLTLPSPQSSQTSPSTSTPTLMYNPTQGVVYTTSGGASASSLLADGQFILNLGQNHSSGAEFLINNNTFSQIQLQQPKPTTSSSTTGAGKRTTESGHKKQRSK